MSRWGTPLRIARRTVRRSIGRSLLIAVLVGLPVAGATFVDVLIRSFDNNERSAYQELGTADGELTVTRERSIKNFSPVAYSGWYGRPGKSDRDPGSMDLASVLPQGSSWIEAPRDYEVALAYGDDHVARPTMVVVDSTSPLAAQEARLTQGRLATAADEVTLTKVLADRLGLLDGDDLRADATVTLTGGGPTAQVTGLVQAPFCLDCEEVISAPSADLAQTVRITHDFNGTPEYTYLVDLPSGVSAEGLWPTLAADQGIALTPREAYTHPEDYGDVSGGLAIARAADLRAAALALLVTGLGLLEVVLLAGTAFAVGARRQIHDLGVISATGATARQIRRIVLAQGLVLGLLGSGLGIAFGALAAVAGRPFWEQLDNAVVLGWSFGVWEIVAAALVGAVSGVLAAVVPAIGAGRMTAVDALSGRFRVSKAGKRRTPILGTSLVVVGVATGVVGDQMMAADFASYVRQLDRSSELGTYVSAPSPTGPVALVLVGAIFAVVGVVVLAPVIITGIGRLAGRLPLSGRLAFRDASRHRHRTGPATSAIAVAVSGSVVLAFVLAGRAEADRLSYTAYLPPDVMLVSVDGAGGDGGNEVEAAAARAAAVLPGASVVRPEHVTRGERRRGSAEDMYVEPKSCPGGCSSLVVGLADPDVMALALGRPATADELAGLAEGKALTLSSRLVGRDDRLTIGYGRHAVDINAIVATVDAVYPELPGAFVSRKVTAAHSWGTSAQTALVPFDGSATSSELDDAKTAIEDAGAYFSLDTGPSDPSRILLIIAAIAAGFVTLVGVAISVALSAAEGRADLATLAAVGAPPRRRRSLAAAQALLVGGLGCGLGLLLGVFVSYTLRATIGSPGFVVPWSNLIVVGLVVPILAMLIAAVFTPSRLPLTVRRGC